MDNKNMTDMIQPSKEYEIEKVAPNTSWGYLFFKRLFDIVVSFLAGVILIPFFLVIVLLIKIDSPGKAIYRQERLGKNGNQFHVLKFRTMHADAEVDGPRWADKDDERCTKIGKKLRKYHIDELPQLWNVFVGDMSFVGPRPERPYFYQEFETYIHGFSNRLAVKPGLTGLAQLRGGYDLLPEEKIIHDMEYIKKSSLRLDLKLFFSTFIVVLRNGREER